MDSGLEPESRTPTPQQKEGKRRLTCSDRFDDLMLTTRSTFAKLNELWDQVDMPDEMRFQRISTALKHTNDLFEEMILSETSMVRGLQENIEAGLGDIEKLRAKMELGEWKMEHGSQKGLPMLKAIKTEMTSLTKLFEDRLSEQIAVIKMYEELCRRLGEAGSIPALEEDELLSKKELDILTTKKHEMESLLNDRLDSLQKTQDQSQKLLRKMGKPKSEASDDIKILLELNLQDDKFVASNEFVESIDGAMRNLEAEVRDFLSTIEFEYEENLIALKELWEKCGIMQDTSKFQDDISADFNTVETLSLMKQEIQALTVLYEERKNVMDRLNEWKVLWNEKLSHEEFEKDPNRFQNRGGQLEKRLKRAKQLVKTLIPNTEKELAKAYNKYLKEHEEGFNIDGVDPVEWVRWKKTLHDENREFEVQLERARKPMKSPARIALAPSLRNLPDLSIINPCKPSSPGPKTSSPKASKRPAPTCSSPCPSPAKRLNTPGRTKNWIP